MAFEKALLCATRYIKLKQKYKAFVENISTCKVLSVRKHKGNNELETCVAEISTQLNQI